MTSTPRRVISSDGVSLAVYEQGQPDAPTIVAIHGYPDNHSVWDGAATLLAERFRVVTYDVRGTGASDKPGPVSSYRIPQLVDDLVAVLDTVSPDEPVHLLAHDWGSIQAWPALVDDRLGGRIATFTSISGPSLDYAGAWLRQVHKHPLASVRQLAHSYYIMAFQLPGLPELAARHGVIERGTRGGGAHRSSAAVTATAPRPEADMVNGIAMYRANMLGRMTRPEPVRTSVPVQVLVPENDRFVTTDLAVEAAKPWVDNLTVRTLAGGHWVVSERPDVIARLVTSFATEPAPTVPHRHGRFGGKLAVVTGAASGIGRSTALEFARQGADVVVADIDDAKAKQTCSELEELGVRAWAHHLDVSDAASWEAFAAALHAVPDILVNNAGIGMGGPFLQTSVADWEKILGVNVWSVIHGSRLFARQMIERGQGGHIANVASAAAFAPSVTLPAYATSKAAVLMLTECLRAELAREGIGVTAVCPGFIDTGITRSTHYVGVDAQTQDELRESAAAAYKRRGYGPDKVARQIVRAVAGDDALAVITPEAKTLRAMGRFTPRFARAFAKVDLSRIGAGR